MKLLIASDIHGSAYWCGKLMEVMEEFQPDHLILLGEEYDASWYCAGAITKKGHPHHPLYLRKDEKIRPFDVKHYLETI